MLRKGESEDGSATSEPLGRGAAMDIVRREKREPGVMMLEVGLAPSGRAPPAQMILATPKLTAIS
jgi:hypothetical protein